jgi:hypothetical protein
MNAGSLLGVLALCTASIGCSGSTGFLGEPQSVSLLAGETETVTETLEAIGAHAGTYELTVTTDMDDLSVSVDPTSVDVDGTADVTVTLTAAGSAAPGSGTATLEAVNGDLVATQTISVSINAP